MVSPEQLYVTVVIVLLFVAVGLGLRVLKRIVLEGVERRRKLQAGEIERYAEDEEYGPPEPLAAEASEDGDRDGRTRLWCPQCGAENDPAFSYCRRCVAPLR